MKTFREFQFGKIIFIFAIPAHAFLIFAFTFKFGDHPLTATSFALANAVLLLVYLLFYGMTTTVDQTKVKIAYGIGLITKRIKVSDITSVCVVSNPWYYGWGIRLIPNGMLYNITGSSGVELTLKDSTRVIRIGSGAEHRLMSAINAVICDARLRNTND